MTDPIAVGVLGATGTVGRRLVQSLLQHPWFRLAEVGASPGSAGRAYGEAAGTDDAGPVPERVSEMKIKGPEAEYSSGVLLSALPSSVAGKLEPELARRGHLVVSNASSHRMDPDVPLVIPEVNPEHLELIERQAARWSGAIVTNPNCSVVGLTLALAPLQRAYGLESALVTTLQSLSGAGRPGPLAAEIHDNAIPHIAGEEEKLAREPTKILGRLAYGKLQPADLKISAQTHRVPVSHGHLLAVSVKLRRGASAREVAATLRGFRGAMPEMRLPSAPARPIDVLEEVGRPQPRYDRGRGAGMTVTVGGIRRCEVQDIKFSVLVHNLVRGAAGAALLNAELCHARGVTARVHSA